MIQEVGGGKIGSYFDTHWSETVNGLEIYTADSKGVWVERHGKYVKMEPTR